MEAQINSTGNPFLKINLDSMYSVVIRCFVVILSGYLTMRLKLVNPSENKGLKTLLLYFLTPAMLISCLINMEPKQLNWHFLACIFAAKSAVFVAVAVITMSLSKNLAKAGLYGIFVTQSNDLALGYPIVEALYSGLRPDFAQYLYLAIPISLLILNPIGFALIEVQRHLENENTADQSLIVAVFKGLAVNPMVIAALLGITGNLLFRHSIPSLLKTILDGYASAYITVALFALGTALSTDTREQRKYQLATPLLLVLTKSLLLPLLIRELTNVAHAGANDHETTSLGNFGFLYGCLPSAPTVFVYSAYANVAVSQISKSLALGTFLSGPWLFLTAQMLSLPHLTEEETANTLQMTRAGVGLVGGFFATVAFLSLLIGGKVRRMPHTLVIGYAVAAMLSGLSMGLLDDLDRSKIKAHKVRKAAKFLLFFGRISLWFWAPLIALAIYWLKSISLCFLLRTAKWLLLLGFAFPLVMSILCVFVLNLEKEVGAEATWLEFPILLVSVVITTGLLVQQQRTYEGGPVQYQELALEEPTSSVADIEDIPSDPISAVVEDNQGDDAEDSLLSGRSHSSGDAFGSREDVRLCPMWRSCGERKRYKCWTSLQKYDRQNRETHWNEETDGYATSHDIEQHLLLLSGACVTIVVKLILQLWKLFDASWSSGILEQVEILDAVLTYGQGIIVWILYGVNWDQLTNKIQRRWRRLRYGSERLQLPDVSELDQKTKLICKRFVENHLARCRLEIGRDMRIGLKKHSSVFTGEQLITWLVEETVAAERASALKYGRRLVLAGVVRHIYEEEHLHDTNSIAYMFAPSHCTPIIPETETMRHDEQADSP